MFSFTNKFLKIFNKYTVHERNHTRILVPEVLCSLGGQEAQNVPLIRPSKLVHLVTFTCNFQSILLLT